MGEGADTDELFASIQCQWQFLWRAVRQDAQVVDILVQAHHDQRAAERFFRTLVKIQIRELLRLETDKLWSHQAVRRAIMPSSQPS